jgi:uncharacterized protein YbjT (DUF2867 family)
VTTEATVLLTGANGQLGRRLIRRLAANEPPIGVRAVVRSEAAAETLRALPESVDVRILDYSDTAALTEAARGCSHAVHLVGIIKEGARSRYRDAHEDSTQSLCRAAEAAGLRRIVYLSILGTDPDSGNACLASKGRAEKVVLDAKTPGLVLRVPMVLGPGDFTARMIRGEAQARFLPLPGGGASKAQPIFADDVVEAIVAGITRDDLDDVALDLAGPESLTQRELIERAGDLHGRRPTIVGVPLGLLKAAAGLAERLMSDPVFTRTSIEVINEDDDVDPEPARARLGITLTPVDEMLRASVGPEAER